VSIISSRKLVPGMRLTSPVLNESGLVMIGEKTELTDNHIRKIQEMGVDTVQVEAMSRDLPPREEMLAQLDKRFSKVEAAPHMDALKRLIAEHIEGLYGEDRPEDSQG